MGKRTAWAVSMVLFAALVVAPVAVAAVPVSVAAAATGGPGQPVVVSVSGAGLGIAVSWTPASVNDRVTSYALAATAMSRQTVPAGCQAPAPTTAPGTDTAAKLLRVCANIAYTVRVTATNAAGAGPASLPSNPVVPLAAQAPSAALLVSVLGRDKALVASWSAPADDGGSPLLGYWLTASAAGHPSVTVTASASATTATVSGLIDGVAYSLSLLALNHQGASAPATSVGTPQATHPPGMPQNLSVVPSAAGSLALSWVAPVDDGGAAISRYAIVYRQVTAGTDSSGNRTWTPVTGTTKIAVASDVTATLSGLSTGNVYYQVDIAAQNSIGTGTFTPWTQPVVARTTLPTTTKVLDSTTLAGLIWWAGGVLVWQYTSDAAVPAVVRGLAVGNVIVGGTSALTPNGLLRTVSSVSHPSAGRYVVGTTTATLSDAADNLSIDANTDPLAPSIPSSTVSSRSATVFATSPGVRILPQAGITFSRSVVLSVSKSWQSGGTILSLDGEVDLTPSISFEASIHKNWLSIPDGADLAFTANLGVEESLSESLSASYGHTFPLGEIVGAPIDIQIGPVPLVLVPHIDFNLTVSASGQISVTTSTQFNFGAKASWSTSRPVALNLQDVSNTPTSGNQLNPTLAANATATATISATASLLIYDITGPDVTVGLGPKVQVTLSAVPPNPWFRLSLELDVTAGWKIDLLIWHTDPQATLAHRSWTLATKTGTIPNSIPPFTVNPKVATVNPGASIQLSTSGATAPVTWTLEGNTSDGITSTGKFTAAKPTGRAVVITARDASGATGTATMLIGTNIGPPRNLTSQADSTGTNATVKWTAPVTNGLTIASYTVSTDPPTHVTTASASATSSTITGLQPGTSYLVTLVARTTNGLTSPPATTEVANHTNAVVITLYSDDGYSPIGIVAGPDGELWYTEANRSIARMTTAGVVTARYGYPAYPGIYEPTGITSGPDGALWFANTGGNSIGRITTDGSASFYYGTNFDTSEPGAITSGPDGALWFTSPGGNSIGRITTDGMTSRYGDSSTLYPYSIVAGPDGALWFTNLESNSIGRVSTAGVLTHYTDPSVISPVGITLGPDGALWFANAGRWNGTTFGGGSIGRITTAGRITHYTDPSIFSPSGITAGPDGALWFTDQGMSTQHGYVGIGIGRITTAGVVTHYTDPRLGSPRQITAGPDGALWFTDYGGLIGRINTP